METLRLSCEQQAISDMCTSLVESSVNSWTMEIGVKRRMGTSTLIRMMAAKDDRYVTVATNDAEVLICDVDMPDPKITKRTIKFRVGR